MKSPQELANKLTRQWENADLREARLLSPDSAFPISLSIGKPPPSVVASDLDRVKVHIESWRSVTIGKIQFEPITYRATATPVNMPVSWELSNPVEWIRACANPNVTNEFNILSTILDRTHEQFHPLLVRQRTLIRNSPEQEVIQASNLALKLEPGCAQGQPLRSLSLDRNDTKFFERNKRLITALLDVRFDGEASRAGLIPFLDGAPEGEHWLLVADLDGSLLPFRRLRVTAPDLHTTELPADNILIVENEQSLHQLPEVRNTIAVLGCGFDLTWTEAPWLRSKRVAYWGDIDTWGLEFLAQARAVIPQITPLLMIQEVFNTHKHATVPEPVPARAEPSATLSKAEQALYHHLLQESRGRLEQEFLPKSQVHQAVLDWAAGQQNPKQRSQS